MASKNTMSEVDIEKYFVEKCKALGMKVIKMVPTYEAGIPDRQVLYKGVSGFAEIKAPGKKPRTLQILYLQELKKRGFYAEVVESKISVLQWIEHFIDHIELLTGSGICVNYD